MNQLDRAFTPTTNQQQQQQQDLASRLRSMLAAKTANTQPWTCRRGPEPSRQVFTQQQQGGLMWSAPITSVHRRVVATVEDYVAAESELMAANRDRIALEEQLNAARSQDGTTDGDRLEDEKRYLLAQRETLTMQIKGEKLNLWRLPDKESPSLSEDSANGESPQTDTTQRQDPSMDSFHTPIASEKENDKEDDNAADRTRLSQLSELTLTPDEGPPTHPHTPPPAPAQSRRSLPGAGMVLKFDPPPRKKAPPPLPSYAKKTTFINFNQFDSGLSRKECLAAISENPPSVAMYSNDLCDVKAVTIISNDTAVSNIEDKEEDIVNDRGWLQSMHGFLCTKLEKDCPTEGEPLPRPSEESELLKATARLLLSECQTSILSSPSPYAAIVRFLGDKVPMIACLPGAPVEPLPPSTPTSIPPVEPLPPSTPTLTPPVEPLPPSTPTSTPPVEPLPPSTPPVEPLPPSTPTSTPPVEPLPPSTPTSTPPVEPLPPSTPTSTPPVEPLPPSTPTSTPLVEPPPLLSVSSP